jgi:hypothetical protein
VLDTHVNLSISMHGLEPFPEYIGMKRPSGVALPVPRDRRQRARAPVRWAVLLMRDAGQTPIASVTDNLSSEGFYCLCDEPLVPGELLACIIRVPTQSRALQRAFLGLRCLVQVVRVESCGASRWGHGCHIEGYQVIPPALVQNIEEGRLVPKMPS